MARPSFVLATGAALAATVLLALDEANAQAQSSGANGLRLTWTREEAAASCPDTPSIEADVVRRLGWDPFTPGAARALDVRVTREGGTWRAVIEYRTSDGTLAGSRVVTSSAETCDSLAAAAALGIALIVRTSTPEPPPAAPDSGPANPPVPAPCTPTDCPKVSDSKPHAGVFAAGAGALGILPGFAPGGALVGNVPLAEHVLLTVSAVLLPEVRREDDVGSYAFGGAFGSVGACYAAKFGERVSIAGCASLELGSVHVVVFEPEPVGPGARFWGAGAVGPRLDWNPTGVLHALFGVELLVPFTRRSFDVRRADGSQTTVFEQPAVGALFLVGVGAAP
jgi:hypothetical protein